MLARNHGHIVTVASAAGTSGVAGLVDYCASKYGAVGIAESLRQELRHLHKNGVHSLCVCPYYINTGMFAGVQSPRVPILEPDYVVNQIVLAMKHNKAILCLPKLVYAGRWVNVTFPTWASDVVADFLCINKSMDHFVQTRA